MGHGDWPMEPGSKGLAHGDWPNGLDIGGFEFDYQHYPEIAVTRLSYQSEWWDPVEQQFHIYL